MQAVNRFRIERNPDHFALHLGASPNADPQNFGEEVAVLMLPLSCAIELAISLFEQVQLATPELQKMFEGLQPRIARLNAGAPKSA